MKCVFMRFPGGKPKAVTLSYDDNVEEDIRLVEIMKKHGLKGTFNINSGQFSPEGSQGHLGHGHRRMTLSQSIALHQDSGMEIACHGVNHPFLDQIPVTACLQEVYDDRSALEKIFGGMVRGLAYPFGTYNQQVKDVLKSCGIAYARTIRSTGSFQLPTDWLQLDGTCHHKDPRLMELAKKFVEDKSRWTPKMFYLWGHSYEFEDDGNWQVIEDFASYIGGREDIWYATNIAIYDYVNAYAQLVFSGDGKRVYNPTNTELFLGRGGHTYSVLPGQTIELDITWG